MQASNSLTRWHQPHVVGEPLALPPVVGSAASQQSFLETLRKLWRHRVLLAISVLVAFAVSVTVALLIPPSYDAEAEVQIGVPEPRVLVTDEAPTPVGPDDEKVENERVVVMSRDLARQVVDRLHLAEDPSFVDDRATAHDVLRALESDSKRFLPASWQKQTAAVRPDPGGKAVVDPAGARMERVIDKLLTQVDVTRMGRSQVLAIDVEAARPDLAASIANTWAAVYLAADRTDKVDTSDRVQQYLSDRVNELRQKVDASDRAVEDYRRQYGLYRGTNSADNNVTSQQLSELSTQLTLAETAKAEADAKLHDAVALKNGQADDSTDPSVLQSPTIQSLKVQQAQAEQNLANLETIYGNRHPKIESAKAAVEDIRQKLSAETARIVAGLRNAALSADIRYATLQKNFDTLQNQMGEVNEKSVRLEALEREATVERNLLEAMLNRSGEIMGRQELEQADAKLVSPAAPPLAPSFPPKRLIVLTGSLAGLLLGMLGALARESIDSTFHGTEDIVAATGLPLIATVPTVHDGPPASQVLNRPMSPFSEALRKIYIGLLLAGTAEPPKSVLLCSSTPSEGKSVLAASLARLLASSGRRVLAIDCDWRNPTLHRIFQCSNKKGLASLMLEDIQNLDGLIFTDPLSGVDVLPAGGWTPGVVHKLASDRMRRLIATLARTYDFVIVDSSPVLVGVEALPLSRMVDKTLFVVRWGHTKREAVLDAVRQLVDARADIAGLAFARVDPKRYREFAYGSLNYDYGL
jgi:polysaccharide biosynthesis transport protein